MVGKFRFFLEFWYGTISSSGTNTYQSHLTRVDRRYFPQSKRFHFATVIAFNFFLLFLPSPKSERRRIRASLIFKALILRWRDARCQSRRIYMRKVSFIELARKGAGECVAGADRWIARRWTVNVTRFLGENAQVNAITSKSMKGRVVLIDVTWLLARRYRPFEWPRNNSSAAGTHLTSFVSAPSVLFCTFPRGSDRISRHVSRSLFANFVRDDSIR